MLMFHFLVALVSCACVKNLLIDDFSAIRPGHLPNDPSLKDFNLLGGDFGSAGATFNIDVQAQTMSILSANADPPIGQPEPASNPGTSPTLNYWFFKLDTVACFNLNGYTGLSFNLVAPPGADMNFTLTQKSPDCSTRLVDSVYNVLSTYVTPNGTLQSVYIPFSNFSTNLVGRPFDFSHLKDITAVNLGPVGSTFTLSQLTLVGDSRDCPSDIKNSALENTMNLGWSLLTGLTGLFLL